MLFFNIGILISQSSLGNSPCGFSRSNIRSHPPGSPAICYDSKVTKYVNINFHFLQYSTSNPQNYTSTGGPLGQGYSGQTWATNVVNAANQLLRNNQQAFQPIGNTTPVNPILIQWVLKGVYYDVSSTFFNTHYSQWYTLAPLNRNGSTEINVYWSPSIGTSGIADFGIGPGPIAYLGDCTQYADNVMYHIPPNTNLKFRDAYFGDVLNHEIGHILRLDHPFVREYSPCSTDNDGCTDTYTFCYPEDKTMPCQPGCIKSCFYHYIHPNPYVLSLPLCPTTTYTNTFMDYNYNPKAVTPCQINIMHNELITKGGNLFTTPVSSNFVIRNQYNNQISNSNYLAFNYFIPCGNIPPIYIDPRNCNNQSSYTITVNGISRTFNTTTASQAPLTLFVVPQIGVTYNISVRAINNCNTDLKSTAMTILRSGGCLTSIAAVPNPTSNQTKLIYTIDDDALISLDLTNTQNSKSINLLKNNKKKKGQNEELVNTANLSSGTYVFQLYVNDVLSTYNLEIIR